MDNLRKAHQNARKGKGWYEEVKAVNADEETYLTALQEMLVNHTYHIMGEGVEHDQTAKDNGARIAAWLLWKNGLTIDQLVTHTYWVNKSAGKTFADVDTQCTNPISEKKWCPSYIFNSNNAATAKKNWLAFKSLVSGYLSALQDGSSVGG